MGLVFGRCGGDDFEVGEADLWMGVVSSVAKTSMHYWASTEDITVCLTCASNCLLLGEADARITRLPRIIFKAGRSSGNGGRGPRGPPAAPFDFSDTGSGLSVYGGGLSGAFSSDMVAV